MPKPDDRSDNPEKLQHMISDAQENIHETDDYLKAHEGEIHASEREDLEAKNQRRERAVDGYRREIQDEVDHT